jgi:hypothetical protein
MSDRDPIFIASVIPQGTKKPERLDLADRVVGWTYDDDDAKADKLTLQIDNFDLKMLDAPIFAKGNIIEFQFGYPGNMSPARECVITGCKGGLMLSIEALAKAVLMNTHRKVRTFEKIKRSDVAKKLAEENGYGEAVQHIDDTIEIMEQVTQAGVTDAQLLRAMAKREGWEFYTDFDGFHFHQRKLGQKPIREFTWYTDPGQGDLTNWTIENDIYVGKSGGVTLQGRDPLKKKPIEVKADNATTTGRATLAPVVEVFTAIDKRDGTATDKTIPPKALGSSTIATTTAKTPAEAQRIANGMFANGQLAAVVLNCDAVFDPQMVAKSIVRINGIGPTLTGNYYVKAISFKHTGAMTFKARRDGKSQASNTTGPAPKGAPTDSKGVPASGTPNAAAPPKKSADGTKPADLQAVNNRDGSISYADTGGRANTSAPSDVMYGQSKAR